jgi:hypothetical protein
LIETEHETSKAIVRNVSIYSLLPRLRKPELSSIADHGDFLIHFASLTSILLFIKHQQEEIMASKLRRFSMNLLGRRRRLISPSLLLEDKLKMESSTLTTIAEEEKEAIDEENNNWQENCITLLSSTNTDENREGLEILLKTIRGGTEERVSLILIYGNDSAKNRSSGELELRRLLLFFLVTKNDGYDSSGFYEDEYYEDDGSYQDSHYLSGIFHDLALQILSSALQKVLKMTTDLESKFINFGDETFWKPIVGLLIYNVESNFLSKITSRTLTILRHLHTLEPNHMQPFLSHVIFPYLVHLRDYGELHGLPLIQGEASRLIAKAENYYHVSDHTI